jgi:hypothetical protein
LVFNKEQAYEDYACRLATEFLIPLPYMYLYSSFIAWRYQELR